MLATGLKQVIGELLLTFGSEFTLCWKPLSQRWLSGFQQTGMLKMAAARRIGYQSINSEMQGGFIRNCDTLRDLKDRGLQYAESSKPVELKVHVLSSVAPNEQRLEHREHPGYPKRDVMVSRMTVGEDFGAYTMRSFPHSSTPSTSGPPPWALVVRMDRLAFLPRPDDTAGALRPAWLIPLVWEVEAEALAADGLLVEASLTSCDDKDGVEPLVEPC
ncbi:hypothetical protein BU17DRAFT_63478 [Hysterangium stoloniferum]|nr:hypothetical protein BU17DRAFT_63478 [Hysterangium stoloniferum]